MQTNLELTNLINECLKHPVNQGFKGRFETVTSILFSGDPESDDKVYTREDFLGLKPDTSILEILYHTMEAAIIGDDVNEFERLFHCHDKIDMHYDNDVFFSDILQWDNKECLNILLNNGFEINDTCIEHYAKGPQLNRETHCSEIIEVLILNYKLQKDLVEPESKSKGMKI